jgi:hypothetical protein
MVTDIEAAGPSNKTIEQVQIRKTLTGWDFPGFRHIPVLVSELVSAGFECKFLFGAYEHKLHITNPLLTEQKVCVMRWHSVTSGASFDIL